MEKNISLFGGRDILKTKPPGSLLRT